MSKKINLKQVAHNSFPERESGFAFQDLDKVTQSYVVYAMKNAVKLALELAADNVEVDYVCGIAGINKQSIIDTINDIE